MRLAALLRQKLRRVLRGKALPRPSAACSKIRILHARHQMQKRVKPRLFERFPLGKRRLKRWKCKIAKTRKPACCLAAHAALSVSQPQLFSRRPAGIRLHALESFLCRPLRQTAPAPVPDKRLDRVGGSGV